MKTKKKNTKTNKKRKGFGVKNYCKACLKIRNGIDHYSGNSKNEFIPHTCKKTMRELNELIYHMNIIHSIRRGGNKDNESVSGFLDEF